MMPTTNGLVHRLQERTANAPLLLQDGRRQQHKACCRLESAQNSIESRRQFVNPGFAYAAPVSLLSIVGAQHEYDYMRTKGPSVAKLTSCFIWRVRGVASCGTAVAEISDGCAR